MARTAPWKKQANSGAAVDLLLKTPKGTMGEAANLYSMMKKRAYETMPKTIRQMTVVELHANWTPPKLSPSNNMTVPPTMVRQPNQSRALSPAMRGVLGVLTSRKTATITNTRPVRGTVLCQLWHL